MRLQGFPPRALPHHFRAAAHRAFRLRSRAPLSRAPPRPALRRDSRALGQQPGHPGQHVPRQPADVSGYPRHPLERPSRPLPGLAQKRPRRLKLYIAKYLTTVPNSRIIQPMSIAGPLRSSKRAPIPIDARAADHLRYIRETMERAGEFTAVPGWGGIAMGFSALAAAAIAARQTTPRAWLATWLIEALVAEWSGARRWRLRPGQKNPWRCRPSR